MLGNEMQIWGSPRRVIMIGSLASEPLLCLWPDFGPAGAALRFPAAFWECLAGRPFQNMAGRRE
eukprot:8050080-Pyramimonas_sp.AAC.1